MMEFKQKRYFLKAQYKANGQKFTDIEKVNEPNKGKVYACVIPFHFAEQFKAFADPLDMPAPKFFSMAVFVKMATQEPTAREMLGALEKASEGMSDPNKRKATEAFLTKAAMTAKLSDESVRWTHLSAMMLISPNECPMGNDDMEAKIATIHAMPEKQKLMVKNWAIPYFNTLMSELTDIAPQCFKSGKDGKKTPFLGMVGQAAKEEQSNNILAVQMNGDHVNHLEQITKLTIGEYYERMNSWLSLKDRQAAQMEKIKGK